MTWLEDLKATPAEVAAVDQVMAEIEDVAGDQLVPRKQPGDDDGPWHDQHNDTDQEDRDAAGPE